jgi:hypothetical protein
MTPEAIADQALSLPATLRAELAAQLLSSLDDLPEAEIEPLWLQVAAQRAEQLDRGQSQRISAQEVGRQARALLR